MEHMKHIKRTECLPILSGQKAVLRPITIEDTPLIVQWRNTSEVRQQFIFRETFTDEMHRHWMETKIAGGEVVQYIIEDANLRKPVGSVYFRDISDQNHCAEFGIFIGDSNARGRGIGTEATQMYLDFGFNTLGLHRISLRLLASNQIAYKCYAKVGFRFEGCSRDKIFLDEKYHDVIFMAILSDDK